MELRNHRSRQRRPRMRIHRNAKTTLGALRAYRRGRQHLDRRQRLGHGRQAESRRSGPAGPRATTATVVVGMLLLAGPPAAGQASLVESSAARRFMGTWVISMESPSGDTFDQTVAIWDEDGKVAAFYDGPLWVPVDRGRGVPIITDVSKDGDDLVLTLGRRGDGGPAVWSRDGQSILVHRRRRPHPDAGRRDAQRHRGVRGWADQLERVREETLAGVLRRGIYRLYPG